MQSVKLFFILLFACSMLSAQEMHRPMKLSVTGSPLLSTGQDADNGLNGFFLRTALSTYLAPNTSVQFNFIYSFYNNLQISNQNSNYTAYALLPSLRYEIIHLSKWDFFVEAGVGFGTIQYEADNENFSTFEHSNLSGGISILSLGGGVHYLINEKVAFEVLMPYVLTTNITSRESHTLFSGLGPTLGLVFNL